MKTYTLKAQDIERRWWLVDAAEQPLGRLASRVAQILRGKHKPTFTPHVNGGDFVIVINAEKVQLTGRKVEQKRYFHHTGYMGHAGEESAWEASRARHRKGGVGDVAEDDVVAPAREADAQGLRGS